MKRTIVVILMAACVTLSARAQESKPVAAAENKNEKLISQYQQEIQDLHSIIKQYDAQIKQLKEQISQLNKKVADLNQQLETASKPQAPQTPATTEPSPAAATPQPAPEVQSYWVNLLGRLDLKRDAVSGKWNLTQNGLVGNSPQGGTAMVILPVIPTGNYDMTFEFCRTNGMGTIQLALPVGKRSVRIVLSRPNGWTADNQYQKYAAGMEYINGMGVLQNEQYSSRNFILTNGQHHYLNVRIRQNGKTARVNIFYDDTELVDWSGDLSALSMYPNADSKQARKFGMLIDPGMTVQVFEARVKMFKEVPQPAVPATKPANE